jgi:hypothetical protein
MSSQGNSSCDDWADITLPQVFCDPINASILQTRIISSINKTHDPINVGTPLPEGNLHLLYYPLYDEIDPDLLIDLKVQTSISVTELKFESN